MSLSDCVDCWETPCVCGHEYKNYTTSSKIELLRAILKTCSDTEFQEICKEILDVGIKMDEYQTDIIVNYKE